MTAWRSSAVRSRMRSERIGIWRTMRNWRMRISCFRSKCLNSNRARWSLRVSGCRDVLLVFRGFLIDCRKIVVLIFLYSLSENIIFWNPFTLKRMQILFCKFLWNMSLFYQKLSQKMNWFLFHILFKHWINIYLTIFKEKMAVMFMECPLYCFQEWSMK